MNCTFFGHKDAPYSIKPKLRNIIVNLIENKNVDCFYIGNQGNFDYMAYDILKELFKIYNISYKIVLAYIPVKKSEFDIIDYSYTVIPEGIEKIPKRFAIVYRNKFMIENSDFVITYITRNSLSGAAKFRDYAIKKEKIIIELSSL